MSRTAWKEKWVVLGTDSRLQAKIYGVYPSEFEASIAIKRRERAYGNDSFQWTAIPLEARKEFIGS